MLYRTDPEEPVVPARVKANVPLTAIFALAANTSPEFVPCCRMSAPKLKGLGNFPKSFGYFFFFGIPLRTS